MIIKRDHYVEALLGKHGIMYVGVIPFLLEEASLNF